MAKSDDFFQLFKDRWTLASEAEQPQRQQEIADLEFEAGQHWDPKIQSDREREGKPCLTIDLLSGPIKQVTNQQRMARPGIDISPVSMNASTKKAEYWQGYIRRVERLSAANRVYTWAGQYQVKMGRGFWAVRNHFIGQSFDQDSRLEEIDNQHTVYCDPTNKKLDTSDKRWAIRWCDYTHEEYKARFGKTALASSLGKSFQGIGDAPPDWITAKHARVAEYYYLEAEPREKWQLSDGSEVWAKDVPTVPGRENGKFAQVPQLPDGVTIIQKRHVTRDRVRFCFLNGLGETIEKTTIPGEFIPIVRIFGERRNINGHVDYRGMVRMAKDPNRMEDFCESALMTAISEAKTAPWLAEWDQIAEFSAIWENSNRVTPVVLPYKRVSGVNGAPIPPPTRVPSGVDVSALTMAAQRMQNHVRNVAGNADVFQDETGAEQAKLSGRAINFRRQQQELGTSDYMENLGDGIVLTAKIIMSQARDMLVSPRIVTLYGEDEKADGVVIFNSDFGEDQATYAQQLAQEHQIQELFDISGEQDDYDIAVSPGKRHDTARNEAVDAITASIEAYPPIAPKALPILFKNSDWPGAQELAKALSPNEDGQPDAGALQQENQQLKQQLQEATQIIQTDQVKQQASVEVARMNNQAKIDLEKMKLDTEIAITRMKLEAERARALFDSTISRIGDQESRLYDQRADQDGRVHEFAMGERGAVHAEQQLDRDAMHATLQNERGHEQAMEQADQGHAQALEQDAQQADAQLQQIQATPRPNGAAG